MNGCTDIWTTAANHILDKLEYIDNICDMLQTKQSVIKIYGKQYKTN